LEYRTSKPVALVLEVLFLAFFFALLAVYTFRANWDIDIYWHIRAGEWMTQNLAIPHTDIFSATDPGRSWTTFQWLYEVIVYEIEARCGFFWVRALHAGLFIAAFMLLYRLFRKRAPGRVAAAFLLVLALALTEDRLRVRPGAFNLFFFVLLLPDLLRPRLGKWVIARLVLISAVWANIHAGGALLLPLGAAALTGGRFIIWLADRSDAKARAALRTDLIRLAATALPMCLMPGFLRGVYTAFAMYKDSMVLIPEWHPPAVYFMRAMAGPLTAHHVVCGSVPYLMLFGIGALVIFGMLRGGWKEFARRRDLGLISLAFMLVLLGAKSARFIYLDPIAAFLLVLVFRREIAALMREMGPRLVVIGMGAALMGISFEYSVLIQRGGLPRAVRMLSYDHEPGFFPEGASDAISGMGLKGRIFHKTSWGGYLIYRHFPSCTVFTDGRGNFTVDERDVLVAAHRPYQREQALEDAWNRYHFDIVVFPQPVFPLLAWDRTKWMLAYHDDISEVFLRVTPGNRRNIERVLAYWSRMGIDTSGGVSAFQDEYLRVLGYEMLTSKAVQKKLRRLKSKLRRADPGTRANALFKRALILFSAFRYNLAEKDLEALRQFGIRHSTATLYLAWSRYLTGDEAGARAVLKGLLLERAGNTRPDQGPLKWGGRQILRLLAKKLGLLTGPPSKLSGAAAR